MLVEKALWTHILTTSDKHNFTLHKIFTDDWSHVYYLWIIVMFLSAVWTHAEDPLVSKWHSATFLQINLSER